MRFFFILFLTTLFLSSCETNNDTISLNGTSIIVENKTLPVINEILFAPVQQKDDGLEDQPDFVEIYNPGKETVNLHGWYFQDCPTSSGKRYTYHFAEDPSADNLLAPGQYGIIVPEESLDREASRLVRFYDYLSHDPSVRIFIVQRKTFSLNNDMDCVTLKDVNGTVIDSVSYNSVWHNPYVKNTKGRSLEKFNDRLSSNSPESWSSSMDGEYAATPGRKNSIYLSTDRLGQKPSLSMDPKTFSPDLDGNGEKAIIRYKLPVGAYQVTAVIYDSDGKSTRNLAEGLPSGPEGSFEWNGLCDDGTAALSGLYLIRVTIAGSAFSGMVELEDQMALVR
ncbi:lamin tail domain-containing protein [Prosthecochloris sp. SCSIO W1102]|uniref:lamin tail domain-containing protein n=1 Tax=Prosthecochloris sp. SCSIO W1102 TaxID=2992243 RepID=UPI00223CDCE9|nr:lamin tail domain-containing protein [Prosthecochloris sp. SCSIO W1102]UZJ40034.1 lamin tail domain-containing protein [Prosthecochloris sp. SCSIO W1102]